MSGDENTDEATAEAEIRRDRPVFELLAWISSDAPDLESARLALTGVTARYPEWRESEYPDLLYWSESGYDAPHPPMPVETLHDMIAADAAAAVNKLRRYDTSRRCSSVRTGTTPQMYSGR